MRNSAHPWLAYAAACAIICGLVYTARLYYHRPQLTSEAVYNFGNVTSGESAEVTYKIRNQSFWEARIENVQSECGCTILDGMSDGTVIPARGSLEGKVNVDTTGMYGKFNKRVSVKAAGDRRPLIFTVSGFVNDIPRATPGTLFWELAPMVRGGQQLVEISVPEAAAPDALKIRGLPSWASISQASLDQPFKRVKGKWLKRLSIEIDPLPRGQYSGLFEIIHGGAILPVKLIVITAGSGNDST